MASKGRDTEMRLQGILEAAGFETYLPPKAKFRNQDVFELFDVLGFGHTSLEAIQVKTNYAQGVTDWFDEACIYEETLTDWRVGYAVLHEEQGWRFARRTHDGYEWVYDGREGGPREKETIDNELGEWLHNQYRPMEVMTNE